MRTHNETTGILFSLWEGLNYKYNVFNKYKATLAFSSWVFLVICVFQEMFLLSVEFIGIMLFVFFYFPLDICKICNDVPLFILDIHNLCLLFFSWCLEVDIIYWSFRLWLKRFFSIIFLSHFLVCWFPSTLGLICSSVLGLKSANQFKTFLLFWYKYSN